MAQVQNANPPGSYATIAASQSAQLLGPNGNIGDYLEGVTVIPGSATPGVVTILDKTTAIITTTVGTATVMPGVFYIPVRAYSQLGGWHITTGAAVSCLAVGKFS